MSMEGLTDICSCNTCTSTILGGRIPQGAMGGSAVMSMDGPYSAKSQEGGAVMSIDGRAEN